MYDVIKEVINLTHIEYYESFKDFINRADSDKYGNICGSLKNLSVIPLSESFIKFGKDNIRIGSKINPDSDLGKSIDQCYNNCKLSIPGVGEYLILQDYGNYGEDVIGAKPLNFIVGGIITASNISLMIDNHGIYVSYPFNGSLVVIKVSNHVVDTSSGIDGKRPFNSQFYLKDNHVCIYIGINSKSKIKVFEDTGVLFDEISTPEFLNKMDSIKFVNKGRVESEYDYIEVSDLLTNGFTSIYEDDSWVECDYGPDPNFIYLIATNKDRIKLGINIDRYGTLYDVKILNSVIDFYPDELPSWAENHKKFKNKILSKKNLKQYIKEIKAVQKAQ